MDTHLNGKEDFLPINTTDFVEFYVGMQGRQPIITRQLSDFSRWLTPA